MERSDDVLIGNTSSCLTNGSDSLNAVMMSAAAAAAAAVSGGASLSTNGYNNNNNTGGNSNTAGSAAATNGPNTASSSSSSSYTMPGILHYLQHEWNRFEYERQQWETERAELMTKISFLQGERRGQENLKNNLIRRIKMLELALKQERIKYHKLMYGVEPANLNDLKSTSNAASNAANSSNDTNDTNDLENGTFSISQHPILNKENTNSTAIKQGRQLLKQYLQEIGYTDTIVDIRSSRLRSLLGLNSSSSKPMTNTSSSITSQNNTNGPSGDPLDLLTNNNNQVDPITGLLNGNKQLLQLSNSNSNNKRMAVNNNITNQANNNNQFNGQQMVNGALNANDLQKILKLADGNNDASLTKSVESAAEDDEEMPDDEDMQTNGRQFQHEQQQQQQQPLSDSDTEDALKEFAFLSSEPSSDDSSDWNVDKAQIARLTEQYKKDRKSSKTAKQQQQQQQQTANQLASYISSQRPNRATLQAMIANLTENSNDTDEAQQHGQQKESQQQQTSQNPLNDLSNSDIIDINATSGSSGGVSGGGIKMSLKSGGESPNQKMNSFNPKMFLEDDTFATDASLGELSRISVNNSINSSINDETVIDSSRKTIYNKYTLRGHLDGVRSLAFHPIESVLLSGSEDQTIKLWNLDKISQNNKKNTNTDVEPIYTFRKHTGAVLSLVISANGDYCISSGTDSNIIIWNVPNYDTTDQYDAYASSVFVKYLNGHTDSVWNMALIDNTLVSVSADSTIRIWNPFSIDDLNESASSSISCLNENKTEGIPTSVDFVNNDKSKIVTSFGATHHNIYDIETSKLITKLEFYDPKINTHCYKVISYPTTANPSCSSLILSAHEDKKIRFFDINSGKLVYQMVAHQDACTDLAIDPTCFYLLSSSHDCSIRLWNLENKNCIQEMTCHRKKYDESINTIAFHPTKPFIASGGADAVVKIYV